MAGTTDPRRVVGARVQTLASFVVHVTRCHEWFGSLASTTKVFGIVKEVITEVKKGRNYTSLRVLWTVNGREIEKTMGTINIQIYVPNIQDGDETETDNDFTQESQTDVVYHDTPWCSEDVTEPVGGPVNEVK